MAKITVELDDRQYKELQAIASSKGRGVEDSVEELLVGAIPGWFTGESEGEEVLYYLKTLDGLEGLSWTDWLEKFKKFADQSGDEDKRKLWEDLHRKWVKDDESRRSHGVNYQ